MVEKGLTISALLILVWSWISVYLQKKNPQRFDQIKVISRKNLTPKSSLLVAEIDGERLLLSETAAQISLIKELKPTTNYLAAAENNPEKMEKKSNIIRLLMTIGVLILIPYGVAEAQSFSPSLTLNTNAGKDLTSSEVYAGLKLSFILSAMVFIPSLIMTTTCFTRIAIVLSMTRQALGTAQAPPNQILLGLTLFLTITIMDPVFQKIYNEALVPFNEDKIEYSEALQKAFDPLRVFMLRHTREQDLALFTELTKQENVQDPFKLGPTVVIPAFVLSELNSAFQIAFLIYLPFVILDMIISSVLTSMSMITLPPTMISLPIKLLLFVVIDGWNLIIGNLVKSYHF
jgi:flagellar biosynthetic protein FliP